MGFGHRVYKTHDPRAKVMQGVCRRVLALRGQECALLLPLLLQMLLLSILLQIFALDARGLMLLQ